jgi:hypothetical protein
MIKRESILEMGMAGEAGGINSEIENKIKSNSRYIFNAVHDNERSNRIIIAAGSFRTGHPGRNFRLFI